jgi:predicted dienelactone hydrolase
VFPRFFPLCLCVALGVGCAAEQPYFVRHRQPADVPDCRRFAIETHDFTVKDAVRTYALKERTGAPIYRELEATVWYPVGAPAGPLIIYSHGFMSLRSEVGYLARALAQCGYVVASASYPRTRLFAPGGSKLDDVANQPKDISLVIDALLTFNKTAGHLLEKKIDPQRIGATGISLGGFTTTLATFHPKLHDPRIVAAVSIAGFTETLGAHFFQTRRVPFLLINGDIDAVIDYPSNARAVLEKAPFASLITLRRGTHLSFSDGSPLFFWAHNPDLYACQILGANLPAAGVNPFEQVGDDSVGCVVPQKPSRPCSQKNLPMSMRPHRQQLLTRLAVVAFFESVFESDAQQRQRFSTYLRHGLAAQNHDVLAEVRLDAKAH